MRAIISTILIIASVVAFVWYIRPAYSDAQEVKQQVDAFDTALSRSRELIATRDALLSTYNSFSTENLERLEKLLPNNVDNVRLILDIDTLASQYGMSLQNISVSTVGRAQGELGPVTDTLGSVIVEFTVSTTYNSLVSFLKDLEESLRVVDITSVAFSAAEGSVSEYQIALRTYWLR